MTLSRSVRYLEGQVHRLRDHVPLRVEEQVAVVDDVAVDQARDGEQVRAGGLVAAGALFDRMADYMADL